MTVSESFSTAGMARHNITRVWNDLAASVLGPMEVEPSDKHGFMASMKRAKLRSCDMVTTNSAPVSIESRGGRYSEASLNIYFQRSGRSVLYNDAGSYRLDPGDFMICDLSRPFRLEVIEQTAAIVLHLPEMEIEERLPRLRDLANMPAQESRSASTMLKKFVCNAWDEIEQAQDFEWFDVVSDVIWPLLDAALVRGDNNTSANSLKMCRRREVLAIIDEEFQNPNFSTRDLAQISGLSPRVLQLFFADLGTTPKAFIKKRRLDWVAKELDRLGGRASITELALDAGFNDLSSFSRTFRRQFGVSARDYREGRLAPANHIAFNRDGIMRDTRWRGGLNPRRRPDA